MEKNGIFSFRSRVSSFAYISPVNLWLLNTNKLFAVNSNEGAWVAYFESLNYRIKFVFFFILDGLKMSHFNSNGM